MPNPIENAYLRLREALTGRKTPINGDVSDIINDMAGHPLTYSCMPEGYPSVTTGEVLHKHKYVTPNDMWYEVDNGDGTTAWFCDLYASKPFELVPEEKYLVTFNGEKFECIAKEEIDPILGNVLRVGIGNIKKWGIVNSEVSSTVDDAPFYVGYDADDNENSIGFDKMSSADIEIRHIVEEIVMQKEYEDITDDDAFNGVNAPVSELFVGDSYKVYYNNEYIGEYTAWESNGNIGIGCGRHFGMPVGDDNAPFVLAIVWGAAYIGFTSGGGYHKVKITHIARHYKPMDEKFMPNKPVIIRKYSNYSGGEEFIPDISVYEARELILNGAPIYMYRYYGDDVDYSEYHVGERITAYSANLANGYSIEIFFNDSSDPAVVFDENGVSQPSPQ